MIALDYFLYDNRTWSPRLGRDWGIKAATGLLGMRADLKAAFERYCGALPSDHGYLSEFGQSAGGIRSRSDDGYLLCVTLETPDTFGRRSWAVYGLWCPTAIIEEILASDPVASVHAALGAESPPSAIILRPAGLPALPRWRTTAGTAFQRFGRKSSSRDAIAILLGAVRNHAPLPDILGITASSRLSALADHFDIVYCHPLDDRGERAFAQHGRIQEAFTEVSPAARPERIAATEAGPDSGGRRMRRALLWSASLAAAAVAMVFVFIATADTWPQWMVPGRLSAEPPARTSSRPIQKSPPIGPPAPRPAEAALTELRERVREIEKLDPADLRRAPSYMAAARAGTRGRHAADRQPVREAYASLLEVRERVAGRPAGGDVASYYDVDRVRSLSPEARLQGVRAILNEHPLGADACRTIRAAFGFEFDDPPSTVRTWCEALEKLERTAGSLPAASPSDTTADPHPRGRGPMPDESKAGKDHR